MFLQHWEVDCGLSMVLKSAKRLRFDYAANFSADTAAIDERGAEWLAVEIGVGGFLIDHTPRTTIVSSLVIRKPMTICQRKS